MIEFKIDRHHIYPNVRIVQILIDGAFVGAVYPEGRKRIKIVSAHFEETTIDRDFAGEVNEFDGSESWPPIPSVHIKFNPGPYEIRGNKIVKLPAH